LSGNAVAHDSVARPRTRATSGTRLCGVRKLARRDAGAGRDRTPQAQPPDRDGRGLGALWRQRTAQAQPGAAGAVERDAPGPSRTVARDGQRQACCGGERRRRNARHRHKKISKSYGERTVVRDVSVRVLRGDRLAIVGPNGAGKTTLLNLLTGRLTPDSGNV